MPSFDPLIAVNQVYQSLTKQIPSKLELSTTEHKVIHINNTGQYNNNKTIPTPSHLKMNSHPFYSF